ncbi:type VI secretion system secreted protein VgrG [Methylovorus glucosotrophus]|uniref:type VI secretion system Vgr family protein n=1 Tax=Methylovorus glucosotrophus TaxID=266009 RepID=UPI001ED277C5|nr:type VI secretion system Vgr family protein [Methylovorus glucosotrophus]KAF0843411.1 type VI secretion system secreted protein VgrG [Methylovorus glucosotrophus]
MIEPAFSHGFPVMLPSLLSSRRLLTLQCPALHQILPDGLEPVRLAGGEGINTLFDYQLTVRSRLGEEVGSDLDFGPLMGQVLTCGISLEGHGQFLPGALGDLGMANQGAGTRYVSGLITDIRHAGEDSRHALYVITLRPWLHLATLTTDCKVFQDKTVVEITEAVLVDYPYALEKRLIETYPARDYSVQYNESDFAFLTRLWREWGISFHFRHDDERHTLVLADHNGAYTPFQPDDPASGYHTIAYYPPDHKTDAEYLHHFSDAEQLTSGSYASRDYDYTRPRAELAARNAQPRNTAHVDNEVYQWRTDHGSDYSQPNAGMDREANQTEPQGELLARLRMEALRQPGHRVAGEGHIRGVVPGHTFTLKEHPRAKANQEYLILSTTLLIENVSEETVSSSASTVRAAIVDRVSGAIAGELTGTWRMETHFSGQPTREVLRPDVLLPHAPGHKPRTHGPETALVTGPTGDTAESNLYTDQYGRIKVQFPWDRYGLKNQHSSCWVRVSQAWAGNQLGAMHLPRIGEEVLIDFLGGDPDLPVCTGRLYNQLNLPPWQLPAQQALSGIRSRELIPGGGNGAAGRSNHLILDDTDGKIQLQLKSDHDSSSLSLGHITRIDGNAGRLDYRGEGLELRTDGHGAIRARQGLILTTEARREAQNHLTDLSETTARLAQAQAQHADLGQLASQHQAQDNDDQRKVSERLQGQNDGITGNNTSNTSNTNTTDTAFPELQQPHLVLASPSGIASTTPGSTHQHSGEDHAITTGSNVSLSANRSLIGSFKEAIKLFAYNGGLRLIAAGMNIEFKALQRNIRLFSKLNITYHANRIHLTADKEIVINGGGSSTHWTAASIESATLGKWSVYSASQSMPQAKSQPVSMPTLPNIHPDGPYSQSMNVTSLLSTASENMVLYDDATTRFKNATGQLVADGNTDEEGASVDVFRDQEIKLESYVGHGTWCLILEGSQPK